MVFLFLSHDKKIVTSSFLEMVDDRRKYFATRNSSRVDTLKLNGNNQCLCEIIYRDAAGDWFIFAIFRHLFDHHPSNRDIDRF